MRKVILSMQASLDNVVSNLDAWMVINDEILRSSIEYYDTIDTIIFGSKSYPFLSDYWTNAEQNSASDVEREFAKEINQKKKLVLSRSSVDLTWNNSDLLKFADVRSLSESFDHLKKQQGKNISVEGGIGTWQLLLKHDLYDELLISIHPAIAGEGEKLFSVVQRRHEFHLKNSKTFSHGVVELHYEKNSSSKL